MSAEDSIVANLVRDAQARLAELPEVPHMIVARFDVPAERAYWYYDTRGRKIVYVNRLALAVLRHEPMRKFYDDRPDAIVPVGIPVIYE